MCKTIVLNAWECETGDELAEALGMPLDLIPRSPSYPDTPDGNSCLCWVDVATLAGKLADRYTMEPSQYDPMEFTFTSTEARNG